MWKCIPPQSVHPCNTLHIVNPPVGHSSDSEQAHRGSREHMYRNTTADSNDTCIVAEVLLQMKNSNIFCSYMTHFLVLYMVATEVI